MEPRHARLSLDELDWEDQSFSIRSFLPQSRLDFSLEQHGMICAPWVWARGTGKYTIVDGFKRLGWARRKGLEQAQFLVFPQTCSYEELFVLRIEGKLFGPPVNPAEKAQIIAQLGRSIPRELIFERILPALGVPQRDDSIEAWSRLSEAGEDLLTAAACGEIAERTALELSGWSNEERADILAVLKELRCSASIQMEVAERIREIGLRDNRSRSAVLRQPELQAILGDKRLNHRQKTEALRALLTRWRFPRLSAREERFARHLGAAALPHSIRLTPPPGFEGERWQLQLSFGSSQELKRLLEKAADFAGSSLIESLLSGYDP